MIYNCLVAASYTNQLSVCSVFSLEYFFFSVNIKVFAKMKTLLFVPF